MSVVVRMEMPNECPCELWHNCDPYTKYSMKIFDASMERFPRPKPLCKGCRIICQLPEGHGRLVDADTFSGHMKEYQERIMKWREQSKTEGPEESYHRADSSLLTVVATKLILDNAPTIVPAERSET